MTIKTRLTSRCRLKDCINKYIPTKSLLFNINSGEGKLVSIFKRKDNHKTLKSIWTLSVPLAAGYGVYLNNVFGMAMLQAYSPLLLLSPIFLRAVNHVIANRKASSIVKEMYLMKNGDQILLLTSDGVYHKVCIQDIVSYKMIEKKGFMNIVINCSYRKYLICTQNKEYVNFEILDKIIKGVCIETSTRKANIRTPLNLRTEDVVYIDTKRTLSLQPARSQAQLSAEEAELQQQMKQLGVPLYNERDFYNNFKISRTDFINKISDLDKQQQEQEIVKLFDEKSCKGRGIHLKSIEKKIKESIANRKVKQQKYMWNL